MIHFAPNTSKKNHLQIYFQREWALVLPRFGTGRFRAEKSRSNVVCDALLLDHNSRSDTYPTMDIKARDVQIGHEATVSKIGEERFFI